MPISRWFDMLPQTVEIAPFASRNDFGEASYGSSVAYKCRIAGRTENVIDYDGQQVTSGQQIYLGSNAKVSALDQITLSTGDVASTGSGVVNPKILAVSHIPDQSGLHHTKLFMG